MRFFYLSGKFLHQQQKGRDECFGEVRTVVIVIAGCKFLIRLKNGSFVCPSMMVDN